MAGEQRCDLTNHDLGGVITCRAKDAKYVDVHKTRGRAMRSKCAISTLKVRYKHSEPRAVWILKVTKDL